MKDQSVFAIVIHYNGLRWIDRCIGGLEKSSIPIRILVIDNGSTDGTQQVLKEKYPDVQFIQSEKNLGFGKAHNIGFNLFLQEKADYVFLLNQDAWVEEDTIEKLIQIHVKNPEYGIISPLQLNGSGTSLEHQFSGYIIPSKAPGLYPDACLNQLKEIYSTGYVNAAAWLISGQCLSVVGGFDPVFNHYGEDDDFCRRALYKNFKIGIVPAARIFHDRPFKIWQEILSEPDRLFTNDINKVKNVRYKFRNNLIGWLKSVFDRTTSSIIFFRFPELRILLRNFFRILWILPVIKKHYHISRNQDCAFLEFE